MISKIPAGIIAVVIFAGLVIGLPWGWRKVFGETDTEAAIKNAIAVERVKIADSVKAPFLKTIEDLRDSVEVQIVNVGALLKTDTVTKYDTVFAIDTATGKPISAVPLPQHTELVVRHDALKTSCSLLMVTCEALKDSVPKLNQLWQDAANARDSVIAHPKPFRRWSLNVTVGTGFCTRTLLPVCGVTGPSYRVW